MYVRVCVCVCVCVYMRARARARTHTHTHTEQIYTLQARMPNSATVKHYIGCGCQSPNPQEIHYFQ
jgi:hypothetical protein